MQYPPPRLPILLALIAAAVAASAPALRAQPAGAAAAAAGASGASAPSRTSVSTARLDTLWLQPEREAPAVVVPRNQSRLAAEVSGVLQRWTVDVGAQVRKGQVLAQIDPRDSELARDRARAALQAAQARLELAQQQLKRARELVAQGFFSQEALAQRETEVALLRTELTSNRAQLALAQRQLDKTALKAPFAGSIRQRLAQTGETVAPGSVLFVLTETGAREVDATMRRPTCPACARPASRASSMRTAGMRCSCCAWAARSRCRHARAPPGSASSIRPARRRRARAAACAGSNRSRTSRPT